MESPYVQNHTIWMLTLTRPQHIGVTKTPDQD